ncbi:MAG: 50S ribosomal protein L4 [Eggerthella lenta]
MRSALSAKLADGELFVVDAFNFEKPSTKRLCRAQARLERRTTLVIDDEDVNTYLSFRNIPTVNILPVSAANTYELIDNKALVFTADALKRIEEVLA